MTEATRTQLVLASASPRRSALLEQIGLEFIVAPADIDESLDPGETPHAYVERMALGKATAIASLAVGRDRVVLGSDTTVVLDGEIYGTPADRDEGLAFLAALSGRTHEVLTAIAAVAGGRSEVEVVRAEVTFREIPSDEARAYWDTGEPADKAGGYGIQGIGGIFIRRIAGSHGAVIGLPLAETEALLRRFGVQTWRQRGPQAGAGSSEC